MLEIDLIRHGTTTLPGRLVGASDIPLSVDGREEIASLRTFLTGRRCSRVICSPLLRCRQTAEILEVHDSMTIDRRIREIDFGQWERMTFAEAAGRNPEAIEGWKRYDSKFSFPGGEGLADFQERIALFARSLATLAGERVMVITHGGVIRHLICTLLRLPATNFLLFRVDCGTLTTLELYSEGAVLSGLNRGRPTWQE